MENNTQNIGNDEIREQVVRAARLVFARFGYKKTALELLHKISRHFNCAGYFCDNKSCKSESW
jgi:hypothetical protein